MANIVHAARVAATREKEKEKEEEEEEEEEDRLQQREQDGGDDPDDGMTPAQRRHQARLMEREFQQIRATAAKTHREKIDEYNNRLSTMTEHNDIPRVSAAGNG